MKQPTKAIAKADKSVSVTFRIPADLDAKVDKLAKSVKRPKSDVIRLILDGEVNSISTAGTVKSKRSCGTCEFFCANPETSGTLDGECRKNPPTVTARSSEFASVFADDWCGAYSPAAGKAVL